MYEEPDMNDATFRIPVSDTVKSAIEEVEQQKRQDVAPVVDAMPIETAPVDLNPPQVVSAVQAAPVTQIVSSQDSSPAPLVPAQYATEASYGDKILYKELSAVSDEVLACRNKVLGSVL